MVDRIKDTAYDGLQFVKQLALVVIAFALMAYGAYGVWQGREKISMALGSTAIIFAGALAVVVGLAIMYKALMRGGK